MNLRKKSMFVTAHKVCCWPPRRKMGCASCGAAFKPDVVDEDGRDTGYWVGMSWSDSSCSAPTPSEFCWGCASLFLIGDYRGAASDYKIDLEEFTAAVKRVVVRERHAALNPQESDYPALAVGLIDHRLEEMRKLETAHVVQRSTFDRECRVGGPYT